MGFTNNYLLGVVVQQALTLAFLGYIPGIAISWCLYDLKNNATHSPIFRQINKFLLVLTLGVLMCLMSGAIAINKLRFTDPSDIF